MSISSVARPIPFLIALLFLFAGSRAFAQLPQNLDASVNVIGQFTSTVHGNGISDAPSRSSGALATFRQSFKPWLGYEINYSYTRFTEYFSNQPFGVQENLHEASGAYLVEGGKFLGFQPFATAGAAWLTFLPTTSGGQRNHQQFRPAFLYEVGVNRPVLTKHFGVRLEYRGLLYKTPDFKSTVLDTGTRRQTSEPAVGLYVRF